MKSQPVFILAILVLLTIILAFTITPDLTAHLVVEDPTGNFIDSPLASLLLLPVIVIVLAVGFFSYREITRSRF